MDGDNSILKFALIGGAAYLGYVYLKNSGLWAQWFGGNSFTDAPSLLAYCQANPTGTASYGGQSAACSAWLQAAGQTPAGTTSTTATPAATLSPVQTPAVTPAQHVTPLTVTQLLNAANQNGYAASANTTFTNDQWNWFVKFSPYAIDPNAVVDEDLTPYGYKTGAELTAQQYISLRQQAGVSGIRSRAIGFANPYGWVN